jgi:MoxR-like ATPase
MKAIGKRSSAEAVGFASPCDVAVPPIDSSPTPRDARLQVKFTQEFVAEGLRHARYVTNERVETAIYLALVLEKPLLIEGPAGAGKTEVAKVLAAMLGTDLVRLQCYEGLDEARALYEWNYQKQLLRLQADEQQQGLGWDELSQHIFSRDYLLERPLLKAISAPRKVVLLIDEIDKSDEEFEAFLLELLSDFQISIPELGTVRARERPVVVLTSNRARELSEALRRRCLHLFIDFPGIEQERRILELKIPDLDAAMAAAAARFVNSLRKLDLTKPPSIAETLDWARALLQLGIKELDPQAVRTTLGLLLKHEGDRALVESKAAGLLPRSRQAH